MHAQPRPTLGDPVDCSPPGSSVHGILQARIPEWAAISSSRGSFWPRNRIHVSCISCIGSQVLLPLYHLGSPTEQILKMEMASTLFWKGWMKMSWFPRTLIKSYLIGMSKLSHLFLPEIMSSLDLKNSFLPWFSACITSYSISSAYPWHGVV